MEQITQANTVDPVTLCSITIAIGRNVTFDLIDAIETMEIYREITRLSIAATRVFVELTESGNMTPLANYIDKVIEPFGTLLSQQWVLGTYVFENCSIQLGKNSYMFYDEIDVCTEDELDIIERHTSFSFDNHQPHQLTHKVIEQEIIYH